jgi:hypothetical protein
MNVVICFSDYLKIRGSYGNTCGCLQCGRERPFATYSLPEVFPENSVYNFLGCEEDILNKGASLKLCPPNSTATQFQNKQAPEANNINTILPN